MDICMCVWVQRERDYQWKSRRDNRSNTVLLYFCSGLGPSSSACTGPAAGAAESAGAGLHAQGHTGRCPCLLTTGISVTSALPQFFSFIGDADAVQPPVPSDQRHIGLNFSSCFTCFKLNL